MSHSRPSWDEFWMAQTLVAGSRSNCPRRQLACYIISEQNTVVGFGYNGQPADVPNCCDGHDCGAASLPAGKANGACKADHAEVNALGRMHSSAKPHTAYVTVCPCGSCAKDLVIRGIKRVVYCLPYSKPDGLNELLARGIVVVNIPFHVAIKALSDSISLQSQQYSRAIAVAGH